jgi:hypothetical protein
MVAQIRLAQIRLAQIRLAQIRLEQIMLAQRSGGARTVAVSCMGGRGDRTNVRVRGAGRLMAAVAVAAVGCRGVRQSEDIGVWSPWDRPSRALGKDQAVAGDDRSTPLWVAQERLVSHRPSIPSLLGAPLSASADDGP